MTRKRDDDGEPVSEGDGPLVDRGPRHEDRTPDEGLSSIAPAGGTGSAIPVCSLRCERCGTPEPIDRDKCDGPCARWIGEECYITYGSDEVYCFDCRPPPPAPTRPPPADVGGGSGLAEGVSRQLQMIEEYYRDSGAKGTANVGHGGDAHLFMGTSAMRDGLCVMPAVQDRVADELRIENAVLKGKRETREERILNKPPGGGQDA